MNDKIPMNEQPPTRIAIERMVCCPWTGREQPIAVCQRCDHMKEIKRRYVSCDYIAHKLKELQEQQEKYGRKND